ncbi:MAG: flagellar hook-basal body complex protein [Rhodospirillales bacterium]|nr:flagellar hook-basal body complex protein [Rhodospirillales bacterium]
MPVYNAFAPSILGMQSQAQSLGTISQNIANATTGGYKRTETRFQTVLSESLRQQSDLGGSRPIDVQMIDDQGIVLTTSRDLDLAIIGDGFFVVGTAVTGGDTFYTRDGSFEMRLESPGTGGTATTQPGYLADKNGYYLKGWAPDATTGVFPTSGAVQALRVDADFFANTFSATTKVDLGINLPASAPLITNHATAVTSADAGNPPAGFHTYSVAVIDSAGNRKPVRLNFTRSALNTWQMSATYGSPSATTAATALTFNGKGALTSPTSAVAFNLSFGSTTASFNLDLSTTTQFDTDFVAFNQNTDGFEKSNLSGLSWDQDGFLVGNFGNGKSRRLYKIPLANFTSPNNLTMHNGMVFEESAASGTPRIEDPNTNGKASFAAGAIESSNVELPDEFSRMIMTQAVYNANALAFRTNDEMTATARDLTRA